MKLLFKNILKFLLALLIGILGGLAILFLLILIIAGLNVAFKTELNPNGILIPIIVDISIVTITLVLFFKFTQDRTKETFSKSLESYVKRNLDDDYVIIDPIFALNNNRFSRLIALNLHFFKNNKYLFSSFNYSFNYIFQPNLKEELKKLEKKLIIINNLKTLEYINENLKENNLPLIENDYIDLSMEYYQKTLRYEADIEKINERIGLEKIKDEKVAEFFYQNYNQDFCDYSLLEKRSKLPSLLAFYIYLKEGGNCDDQKTS